MSNDDVTMPDRPVHPAGEASAADCMALAVWAAAPHWPVTVNGTHWTMTDPTGAGGITVATPNPVAAAVLKTPPSWSVFAWRGLVTLQVTKLEAAPVSGQTFDGIVTALQGLGILPPPRLVADECRCGCPYARVA